MLLKDVRFLVTQNAQRDVLEHVDVRIEDGIIEEIGEDLTKDGEIMDCSNSVVLPGLVNTHTHAPMNVMRGISDNRALQSWLEDVIFPAEQAMDEDGFYHGSLHSIIEMAKTGTTCFNDMYAPETPVADAVDETGMRAVLARGMIDADGDRTEKLRESKEFIEQYQEHDRITPAVSPHAIYTCSEELLRKAQEQAEQYDTLYHIHLSETKQENEDCEAEHGMTPTAYLHDHDLLTERTIAAHGVWLTEKDMRLFQKTSAGVAHNPCSNLKLGSGIADVPRLQAHDITVGLGTDSVASNNNLNMFEEAKFASLLQKRHDPRNLTEQELLDMLTIDGAELLGLDDRIGSIEEGKQADFIRIDRDDIALSPFYGKRGLLSNLIFSFHGQVNDVFVAGDRIVQEGTMTTIDEAQVKTAVQEHAEHLDTIADS